MGETMADKTYEQILEMASKKPLTANQFTKFFEPIINSSGYLVDSLSEAKEKANEIIENNNLDTKTYQHIWTVVVGQSGNLCTLNGNHMFDRFGYIVCKTPWGDGTDKDKDVYIEAKY